jgi:hypothetical protein
LCVTPFIRENPLLISQSDKKNSKGPCLTEVNTKMTFSRTVLSRAFEPHLSAAVAFLGLFKAKAERDQARRQEEAAAARAYDYTRRLSKTVLRIIDSYRDEKVVPVAANAFKAFKAQLDLRREDANSERVMEMQVEFANLVKKMAHAATAGAWDSLGEWNHALMGSGLKAEIDCYIFVTFGKIWKHIEERAAAETASVVARSSGHATQKDAPLAGVPEPNST